MALETEYYCYYVNQQELLQTQNGRFVLIIGMQIVGAYDTMDEAVAVGLELFGNTPFLVKKVEESEANSTSYSPPGE